jgi:hypothetical protein
MFSSSRGAGAHRSELRRAIPRPEQLVSATTGSYSSFVFPETISDLAGLVLLGLIYFYGFVRNRQNRRQEPAAVDTGK